jgi:hypothetical protein
MMEIRKALRGSLLLIAVTTAMFAVTLGGGSLSAEEVAAAKGGTVLKHVVMYKFKPEISAAQVQEVVDTFAGLPSKIDTIIGFETGTNVSEEGKSEGFTHVFVVTFRDKAGLKTYLDHPAHAEYVQVVKGRREKVIVFDYEVPTGK